MQWSDLMDRERKYFQRSVIAIGLGVMCATASCKALEMFRRERSNASVSLGRSADVADVTSTASTVNKQTLLLTGKQVDKSELLKANQFKSLEKLQLCDTSIKQWEIYDLDEHIEQSLSSIVIERQRFGDSIPAWAAANCPNLTHFEMRPSFCMDSGLVDVGKLPKLETLILETCRITGFGFSEWPVHPKLRHLSLKGSPVDANSFQFLRQVPNLQSLNLDDCQIGKIGNSGFELLAEASPQLANLSLRGATIDDLRPVASFRGLTHLNVEKTLITSDSLRAIANHPSLEVLNLSGTKIDDGGIEHCVALPRLRELIVVDTDVTDAGIDRFRQSRKDVVVVSDSVPTAD
jgi:Leucine-rich repeat (LRR) protein